MRYECTGNSLSRTHSLKLLDYIRTLRESNLLNMTNKCDHQCSGNCRRRGCNCLCGEWHEEPTEEWEKNNLIEHNGNYYVRCEAHEEVVRRLQEKHKEALTSNDAELRRKIEKFIDENDDGMWAGRETADAVLALFDKKNV